MLNLGVINSNKPMPHCVYVSHFDLAATWVINYADRL